MLIKSNRTALQTYKVEEGTFGTPCIFINVMMSDIFAQELGVFRYVKSVFRACFLILRLSSSFDQWPRAHISHVTFTIRLLIEYGSCKFGPEVC